MESCVRLSFEVQFFITVFLKLGLCMYLLGAAWDYQHVLSHTILKFHFLQDILEMDSIDVEYSIFFYLTNDTKKIHKLIVKYLKTKNIPNRLQPEIVSILCKFKIQRYLKRIDLEKNHCTTKNMRFRVSVKSWHFHYTYSSEQIHWNLSMFHVF